MQAMQRATGESQESEPAREPSLGSPFTRAPPAPSPYVSGLADLEMLRRLATFMSPSSIYLFPCVLLDLKFHLDPRIKTCNCISRNREEPAKLLKTGNICHRE